jgi:hypothetical protein
MSFVHQSATQINITKSDGEKPRKEVVWEMSFEISTTVCPVFQVLRNHSYLAV